MYQEQLLERLTNRTAQIGIIGLGYVGLPLAVAFAEAGFTVTGLDVSSEKVDLLNSGQSYIPDIPTPQLAPLVKSGKLRATTNYEDLRTIDAVSICVPTPLRKTKDPDMSYVISASDAIARELRPGQLIILESTTYPGTTEELILPNLEAQGLRVGEDFFLAYSPERVDPGNGKYATRDIPKVVGGVTPRCSQLATLLYASAMSKIVPVSSTRVAEMVKLLENTFRSVNIALVNEIALMC